MVACEYRCALVSTGYMRFHVLVMMCIDSILIYCIYQIAIQFVLLTFLVTCGHLIYQYFYRRARLLSLLAAGASSSPRRRSSATRGHSRRRRAMGAGCTEHVLLVIIINAKASTLLPHLLLPLSHPPHPPPLLHPSPTPEDSITVL